MPTKTCTAEWIRPYGAALINPRAAITTDAAIITCQREVGHEGRHEAVVPDENVSGLQYRMAWEAPNAD